MRDCNPDSRKGNMDGRLVLMILYLTTSLRFLLFIIAENKREKARALENKRKKGKSKRKIFEIIEKN